MQNTERHYKVFIELLNSKRFVKVDAKLFRIHSRIDKLIESTKLEKDDIVNDLFKRYLESGGVEKYASEKGNLFTWMKQWLDKELDNYMTKQMGKQKKFERQQMNLGDLDANVFTYGRNPSVEYSKELFWELIRECFSQPQIEVLLNSLTVVEAANEAGVSRATFIRRLQQSKQRFIELYNDLYTD